MYWTSVQIVRACALCAAFKYGLTPAWKGAMTTFSEETTKAARVVTRERLVAGIEHGMRFDTDQVMASWTCRVALLRIAYKRGHFASLTHIRGEVTRELVHKYLERQRTQCA
jgi:hypothetical protein